MGERLSVPVLPTHDSAAIEEVANGLETRVAEGGRIFFAPVETEAGEVGQLLFLSPEGATPKSRYALENGTLACYLNSDDPTPIPCESLRVETEELEQLLLMQSNFTLEQ